MDSQFPDGTTAGLGRGGGSSGGLQGSSMQPPEAVYGRVAVRDGRGGGEGGTASGMGPGMAMNMQMPADGTPSSSLSGPSSIGAPPRPGGAYSTTAGSVPEPNYPQPPPSSASATSSAAHSPAAPRPIRRRMRMITSCLECRRRKLKCDKSSPCTNCVRFHRECVYLGPKLDEAGQLRLTQIKEKVGSLERQLERDVVQNLSTAAKQQRIIADDVEERYAEESGLEPTDMVALDHTYEDMGDDTDEVIDLGVLVGRMRLTDRIGGFSRPRISEEVCKMRRDETKRNAKSICG